MIELTASKLRSFKSCPKKYFFEYVECLKPETRQEALETGSSYHSYLEKLLKGEPFEVADLPSAMAEAFDRFVPWRGWNVKSVEKEFRVRLDSGIYLKGKIDAICEDGTPVEHKSSSAKPDEKYRERLFLDDQVSCYLLALSLLSGKPMTHIVYTVCAKPKLAPSKKLEGDAQAQAQDLLERQRVWFDADKVDCFTVVRSVREIEDFKRELVYMGRSLQRRKVFYRNPGCCSVMPCAYQAICQDYDPACLVGFVKKERQCEELNGNFKW